MRIKQFSEQERLAFKAKHDLAKPKEWAVMDGSIVYNFYNTEQEANAMLKILNIEEEIADNFDIWVDEQAENYGISVAEVISIVT